MSSLEWEIDPTLPFSIIYENLGVRVSGPVPAIKYFTQSNPNFISYTSDSTNFSILSCGTSNRDKKVLSKINFLRPSTLKQAIKAIFKAGLAIP